MTDSKRIDLFVDTILSTFKQGHEGTELCINEIGFRPVFRESFFDLNFAVAATGMKYLSLEIL